MRVKIVNILLKRQSINKSRKDVVLQIENQTFISIILIASQLREKSQNIVDVIKEKIVN